MTTRQPGMVVDINGTPYFLMRSDRGAPEYHDRQVQTQEGDPTAPRRYRWSDWSRGMGDSRGVFRGAVESATNAFLGMLGRILPGPKINTIATAHGATITSIVEVTAPATRIISFGGRYAKEVNPATQAVTATQDFGVGTAVSGTCQLFIDQVAIPLGAATQFYRRLANGTYAPSTTTAGAGGDYRYASCFGLSAEGDLVRGRGATWSKCSAADFYATNGNWTTEYTIGDASGNVNEVGSFERWDYALKDEGLYSFDSAQSKESNVLPDLRAFRSRENRRWFPWYNRLFLCTFAGLYRYVQNGGARTVGMEEAELNEGILTDAYPTAGVAFGKWAYVAFYDGATTYICMVRNTRDGDANFGSPFTIVSTIDSFTGRCDAMLISSAPASPTCYYGREGDLAYFELTRTGRPKNYRDSGSTVVTFAPTDLGSPMTVKYARGVEVIGRNASAVRTITFEIGWDGGALNTIGSAIQSFTASFASKFLTAGANDSGRVAQLRATMVNNSTTTPPEVRDVILNFEERPVMTDGAVFVLRLNDQDHEGEVSTHLSAVEQLANILALTDGAPVNFTDPYGETYKAAFSAFQGDIASWQKDRAPQNAVALSMRRLDYA